MYIEKMECLNADKAKKSLRVEKKAMKVDLESTHQSL